MKVNPQLCFNDNVDEYEVDPTWEGRQSEEYYKYRRKLKSVLERKDVVLSDFPLCIEVESTYHCNLECPYCARGAGAGYRSEKHLSPEIWRRILDEARSNYLPSMMMDHEGESLLNPALDDMISDARDAGVIDIFLHTNGQALTPQRSESLIDSGLTKINISIDAVTQETYAKVRPGGSGIDKVIRNVNEFLELRKEKGREDIRVRVSFVVSEDNHHEKEQFFNAWHNKVNVIAFQKMINMDVFSSQERQATFIEQCKNKSISIDGFSCDHLWLIPVIDVEGNIIPCGMPVRDHLEEFYLGNISQGDTIAGVWNSTKMKSLREAHKQNQVDKITMCHGCAYSQREAHVDVTRLLSEHGK